MVKVVTSDPPGTVEKTHEPPLALTVKPSSKLEEEVSTARVTGVTDQASAKPVSDNGPPDSPT
jgi:hypothetical protein